MNNISIESIQKASYGGAAKVGRLAKSFVSPLGILGLAMLFGHSTEVLAVLPGDAGEVLPDTVTEGADSLTLGAQMTEILLKWGATILGIAIVIGSIASIFKSFRDRKNGDNSDFAATMGGGLVMIVIGLGVTILALNYADGIAQAVLQIGGGA